MPIRRLLYADVAPGAAFHAVRAAFAGEGQSEVALHCHDFLEWMVVLNGEATHVVNETEFLLRTGHLVLIRPDDRHAIYPHGPGGIEFVNIAFPVDVWDACVIATGLESWARAWSEAAFAPAVVLTGDQRQRVRAASLAAVRSYHNNPSRLAFSPFWTAAAGALADYQEMGDNGQQQPAWLRKAVRWAERVDVEDLSLESLVEKSGVSFGHLSRTLKAHSGVTPTEFINALRVKRAAFELATTDRDIAAIAFDCGFENLSYFYRRFRQIHGKTPLRYREDAKRSLPL